MRQPDDDFRGFSAHHVGQRAFAEHEESVYPVSYTHLILVGRDAAHKRMAEAIREGGEPPFPIENEIIYYAGPAPTPPGAVIGPVGPTTSGRMDPYTCLLYTSYRDDGKRPDNPVSRLSYVHAIHGSGGRSFSVCAKLAVRAL